MSRHRKGCASTLDIVGIVRSQMSDKEIVDAALALTTGDAAYERRLSVLGRPVRLQNRGLEARMGRHGGGWDFVLGVQTGRSGLKGTIIVNLGKGSIRIDPKPSR